MYSGKLIDFHTHVFLAKLYDAIGDWFKKNLGWNFYFKGSIDDVLNFLENNDKITKYVCFGYAHKSGISKKLNEFYFNIKENIKRPFLWDVFIRTTMICSRY